MAITWHDEYGNPTTPIEADAMLGDHERSCLGHEVIGDVFVCTVALSLDISLGRGALAIFETQLWSVGENGERTDLVILDHYATREAALAGHVEHVRRAEGEEGGRGVPPVADEAPPAAHGGRV